MCPHVRHRSALVPGDPRPVHAERRWRTRSVLHRVHGKVRHRRRPCVCDGSSLLRGHGGDSAPWCDHPAVEKLATAVRARTRRVFVSRHSGTNHPIGGWPISSEWVTMGSPRWGPGDGHLGGEPQRRQGIRGRLCWPEPAEAGRAAEAAPGPRRPARGSSEPSHFGAGAP